MKRSVVVVVLLLLALVLPVACAAPGSDELTSMLAAYDDHAVQVSVLVVDLDTGERVFAREPQRLCRPASTMKLLPTSAICRLVPGGSITTRLVASGMPEGEVTLVGNGDPMLSAQDVRELAAELKAKGLVKATGSVRCADPLLHTRRFGLGWMWDDEPEPFLPVLSGATIDGGCVTVQAKNGEDGLEVKLLPVAGPLKLRVSGGGDRLSVGRGRYRNAEVVRVVGGVIEDHVMERRVTVPDPALYTAHVVGEALQRFGMGGAPDGYEVVLPSTVGRHALEAKLDRSIADVVVNTNKVSDNLGAEMLLRWVGAHSPVRRMGIPPHPSKEFASDCQGYGRQRLRTELKRLGFGDSDYRIADGSGVSHYNLVSAELLVSVLADMHKAGGPSYELFRRSLPIAGVDGTLASRMKDTLAKGRVFAKTGTISAVSNLAGYVETKSGRNLAFAIMCQNFVGFSSPWRYLQDDICAVLAEL